LFALVAMYAYHGYNSVKPVYYATSSIGLAPPSITQAPDAGQVRTNGLLAVGGVGLLTNLLALGLSDPPVQEQVAAQGGLAPYTAQVFSIPGAQLPIVVIDTTADDPDQAAKTLDLVAAQSDGKLRSIQASARIPEDQMLQTYAVGTQGAPIAAIPNRLRGAVATFVGGLGLVVLVTVLIDVLIQRRRDNRATAQPDPSSNGRQPGADERNGYLPKASDTDPATPLP
jgi:hypothetical protein